MQIGTPAAHTHVQLNCRRGTRRSIRRCRSRRRFRRESSPSSLANLASAATISRRPRRRREARPPSRRQGPSSSSARSSHFRPRPLLFVPLFVTVARVRSLSRVVFGPVLLADPRPSPRDEHPRRRLACPGRRTCARRRCRRPTCLLTASLAAPRTRPRRASRRPRRPREQVLDRSGPRMNSHSRRREKRDAPSLPVVQHHLRRRVQVRLAPLQHGRSRAPPLQEVLGALPALHACTRAAGRIALHARATSDVLPGILQQRDAHHALEHGDPCPSRWCRGTPPRGSRCEDRAAWLRLTNRETPWSSPGMGAVTPALRRRSARSRCSCPRWGSRRARGETFAASARRRGSPAGSRAACRLLRGS